MQKVVTELAAGEKVDYAARCGGYLGAGSFYAAFEDTTGLRPAQIRVLSQVDLGKLLAARLEIEPAKLRRQMATPDPPIGSGLP
jgi:hypothetical protein